MDFMERVQNLHAHHFLMILTWMIWDLKPKHWMTYFDISIFICF